MGILHVRKEVPLLRCTFVEYQDIHCASNLESSQTYSDGELNLNTGFSRFSRKD